MNKHLTVIPRISEDERTVAVVQWEGDVPESELLTKLTAAVTEWVDVTPEGRGLWQYTGGDLNIGDLATHGGDSRLDRILSKHGISNLDISTFCDTSGDPDWTYDTVLVDGGALSDQEEDEDR